MRVAKGVITGPNQLHLAYVHSPMRYAWDLQHQYLRESNLTRGVRSALARLLLHKNADLGYAHVPWRGRLHGQLAFRRPPGCARSMARTPRSSIRRWTCRRCRRQTGWRRTTSSPLPAWVPVQESTCHCGGIRGLAGPATDCRGHRAGIARGYKLLRAPNVKFAGFVPDAELGRMMGAAQAFNFCRGGGFRHHAARGARTRYRR